MACFKHAGLRLRYECSGKGPAALLLHGIGASAGEWDFQLSALEPDHTVIRLDLRGHGRSELGAAFTIGDLAADAAALLAHLGVARAHVIGHSLGGAVALSFALNYPERISSLTLANTFARWRPASSVSGERALRRLWFLARGDLQALNAFIAEGMFPGPELAALRHGAIERLNANLRPDTRRVLWRTLLAVAGFDERGRLGRVAAPTLVVIAGRDSTVSPACSEELATGIPLSRRLVLADAGHGLPMEIPTVFNSAWRRFAMALSEGGATHIRQSRS